MKTQHWLVIIVILALLAAWPTVQALLARVPRGDVSFAAGPLAFG